MTSKLIFKLLEAMYGNPQLNLDRAEIKATCMLIKDKINLHGNLPWEWVGKLGNFTILMLIIEIMYDGRAIYFILLLWFLSLKALSWNTPQCAGRFFMYTIGHK
jgi:hypothetical protein